MSTNPLVNCIVPVYNGERYLGEALESVLSQSYQPVGIIVVDDGSTDGTAGIAARYGDRIAYVRQENSGPVAARNRGLKEAGAQFIGFLDADDLWLPDKLQRQMSRFEANPAIDISVALMRNFWAPEVRDEEARLKAAGLADGQTGQATQTIVARRTAFDKVGPLDESLPHRDAMDWMVRARDVGLIIEELPEVLAARRVHETNRSRRRQGDDRENMLRIVKASLDRRRRLGKSTARP